MFNVESNNVESFLVWLCGKTKLYLSCEYSSTKQKYDFKLIHIQKYCFGGVDNRHLMLYCDRQSEDCCM